MASTQQLKHRMGSIKNTKQITKAMELVSASKMRRAQDNAFKSRDYRTVAMEILTRLRKLTDVSKHPLFKQRTIKTRLYVVITSDRTLAGAYNSNVLKAFTQELQKDAEAGIKSEAIVVGRQVARFTSHLKELEVVAVYEGYPEQPTTNDIRPILSTLISRFIAKEADAVDVIYTDFKSSIRQEVAVQRLLPAAFDDDYEPEYGLDEAIFEPTTTDVLDNVTERLVEVQLSQDLLESFASEHSMRMLAMKSATDNASDLIDDLTLAFNTARQASITQEIAEITGGAEAMK
jgi:F-type H+-transporting ATPase subunit gamma